MDDVRWNRRRTRRCSGSGEAEPGPEKDFFRRDSSKNLRIVRPGRNGRLDRVDLDVLPEGEEAGKWKPKCWNPFFPICFTTLSASFSTALLDPRNSGSRRGCRGETDVVDGRTAYAYRFFSDMNIVSNEVFCGIAAGHDLKIGQPAICETSCAKARSARSLTNLHDDRTNLP